MNKLCKAFLRVNKTRGPLFHRDAKFHIFSISIFILKRIVQINLAMLSSSMWLTYPYASKCVSNQMNYLCIDIQTIISVRTFEELNRIKQI